MMNKGIYLSAHVVLAQLPTFDLALCLFVCLRIGREAKLTMKIIDRLKNLFATSILFIMSTFFQSILRNRQTSKQDRTNVVKHCYFFLHVTDFQS